LSDGPPDWFDRAHGYTRREDDGRKVEIVGEIRMTTERAVHFYDGSKTVWLARSLIDSIDETTNPGCATIVIPEWLAKKEGLI
jgi:hypothetical protein